MDCMMSTSQTHINIADDFTSHVVDILKAVEKRSEESKKKVYLGKSGIEFGD